MRKVGLEFASFSEQPDEKQRTANGHAPEIDVSLNEALFEATVSRTWRRQEEFGLTSALLRRN